MSKKSILKDIRTELSDVLGQMKMANETDQPTRSRHLSLAVTYGEDAINRLDNAIADAEAEEMGEERHIDYRDPKTGLVSGPIS